MDRLFNNHIIGRRLKIPLLFLLVSSAILPASSRDWATFEQRRAINGFEAGCAAGACVSGLAGAAPVALGFGATGSGIFAFDKGRQWLHDYFRKKRSAPVLLGRLP